MEWGSLVPLAVAIVTALGGAWGYLRLARKASGRIDTSEASELWKEASEIRKDYRERLLDADHQLQNCRSRIRELEVQLREAERRQW